MNLKLVCVGLISSLFLVSVQASTPTPTLQEQRARFQKWQQSSKLTIVEQQKQLESLKGYALYPYAQYQYLQNNLATVSPKDINQFTEANKDFPYTSTLIQNYLAKLTSQKNWQSVVEVNQDSSLSSQCYYLYGLYQTGQKTKTLEPVHDIWLSGKDLPSACDPLFDVWASSGGKTANTIMQRIELVLQNNNIKLARYLTNALPDNYKTLKKNLYALYDNPRKLTDFAKNMSPSSFSKKVTVLSFQRLVNTDADMARSAIPELIKQQKLSSEDEQQFLRKIAFNYFKDSATAEQVKWRDQFIAKDRAGYLVERRIRLALHDNDSKALADWLNLLPKADQQKEEWRYWQAVVLLNNNQEKAAKAILEKLALERGFYAMYSAQKLNKIYQFDFDYSIIANKSIKETSALIKKKYQNMAVIQRINELRYWSMYNEANREWRYYLYNNTNDKNYAEIARYAYEQNWGAHSVQATIAGKLWDNWLERFPVVHKNSFTNALKDKDISLSYALAISRQESALEATVMSPAGARGLMQLMPATAKETAKKIPNFQYNSSDQLYLPDVNVQLGSRYLENMYQQFGKNRILASAAYNAGPNRLKRWLAETDGQIDAIAFIESIPFTETRNYVKSVLVYDYIYRLILENKTDKILYQNELDRRY